MLRLVAFRFLRWIPLSALLLSVQALAQFEIAPDHFDSAEKDAATHRAATKDRTKATRRLTSNAVTHTSSVGGVATAHHKGNVGRTAGRADRPAQPKQNAAPGLSSDRLVVARKKRAAASKIAKVSP